MTALIVIALFIVFVVVHEFGHFLVAKITRVRVEEFGVGYPPRAFLLGMWGGTSYTINWLPFGGFVRLYGEEEEGGHGPGAVQDAPRLVQAGILVAGVAANALLAWMLFAIALHIGVPTVVSDTVPGENTHLFISDVVPGSPASAGGLASGDEIIGMKDPQGIELGTLSPDAVLDYVRARGGQPITISYLRQGTSSTASVRPANAVVPGAAGRPALGVGLALVATRPLDWPHALSRGLFLTNEYFAATVSGLWHIVTGAVQGKASLSGMVGPVGLVGIVSDVAHSGIGNVIKLAGFISINLAVVNLIPIPVLDGGRLVLLGAEGIIRRRAPRLLVQFLNTLGIALIMLLMVVVTYHDIAQLLV